MPSQVTISSALGITPPFSGTACDVYGNNCSYVGSGTTLPITFTLPSQFDTAPEFQLTITDSIGCSLSEVIFCTPNPTPPVIQSGLVAWYDIANPSSYPGSGPDLYDLTTNNNDILLSGGTYYSALGGGSLSFDGACQ